MVKNKQRPSRVRSTLSKLSQGKEPIAPVWLLDGCVGILALMIYNFALYFLSGIGIGGIIQRMQDATGYLA